GPRANRDCNDFGEFVNGSKLALQVFGRSVRVGIGLVVGNKLFGAITFSSFLDPLRDLIAHRDIRTEVKAVVVAVNASAGRLGAIPVGTGKSGIDRYLLDALAIALAQIMIHRTIGFVLHFTDASKFPASFSDWDRDRL